MTTINVIWFYFYVEFLMSSLPSSMIQIVQNTKNKKSNPIPISKKIDKTYYSYCGHCLLPFDGSENKCKCFEHVPKYGKRINV